MEEREVIMSSYFEWTTMIDRGMDPDVHLGPKNLLHRNKNWGRVMSVDAGRAATPK
jgi:hypothetical protein